MSEAHAVTVNGPTDLAPDELAERKRAAAVDYYTRELGLLEDAMKALSASKKPGAGDKIIEQRKMIADTKAALTAAKGA